MKISKTARVGFIAALFSVAALVAVLRRESSPELPTSASAEALRQNPPEAAAVSRAPSEPDAIAALARGSWTRGSNAIPLLPAAGGFETQRASAREGAASSWTSPSDAVSKIGSSRGAGFSVSWRGKGLDVRPAFGHDVAPWSGDGLVVYPEIAEGMHSVVMALPQGLEEFLVLDDASIAPNFEYTVVLPGWVTRVRETEQGTVEFWDGEAAWLRADAPEAKDALDKTYRGRARVTEVSGREEAVAGGRQWAVKGGELRITFELDLSGAAGPVVVDPGWSSTGSMAAARVDHTSTLLPRGKVLVAGGFSGSGAIATCELYDPALGIWTATGSMGAARYRHSAALLPSGKVLVAAGVGSGYLTSCELYDPDLGTWAPTGSMAAARELHVAKLLPGGKVLVAGGDLGGTGVATCELYDPNLGTWAPTGSMAAARTYHAATLLSSGKVLVAGGFTGSVALSTCELYDPGLGTWTATGSMGAARFGHTAMLLASGIVLVSGGSSGGALASCELYDPGSETWAPTGSMATPRQYYEAALLPGGKVLVAGGFSSGFTASCELYDPASGTWAPTGSMAAVRDFATATLLASGKVLVAGGYTGIAALATCELFDPANGAWSVTGSMSTVRYVHSATLLPSGKVLIAGGYNGSITLSTCELYDPESGLWSGTGPLAAARYAHTATLLPSGKVLVAGGYDSDLGFLSTSELYDPVSGMWSSVEPMTSARGEHTMTLLPDGKILLAGGRSSVSTVLSSCELYDPVIGTWSAIASMSLPRYIHNATLLTGGKVLVAGGIGTSTCEVYDPVSGTWSPTGSMATGRYFNTATLLPSGKVLVAGGYGITALCELYDPASGTWAGTGSMVTPRAEHSAALLPSGMVLVSGGYFGGFLSASELYDPATGTWLSTGSMSTGRVEFSATLLPSGRILAAGGYDNGALSSSELFDAVGGAAPWKPSITAIAGSSSFPVSLVYGTSISVDGNQFKGVSEASGGNGGQNSSSNYPMVRLVGLPSGGGYDSQDLTFSRYFTGSATGWASGNTLTFTLPTAANNPDAYYLLYVITNGIPSDGKIVRLSAPVLNQPPVVSLGPPATVFLNHTYSGAVTITDPTSTSWNVTVTFQDGTPPFVVTGATSSPVNFTHQFFSMIPNPSSISAIVTDNQGAVGSSNTMINVVTPLGAVASTRNNVQALVPAKLSAINAKLLTQVLDSVTLRINQGQPAAAISLLRTFVSYIVRFRATGALPDPDAQGLIDDANAVISGLTP